MKIQFTKMSASGNDFVVLDNRADKQVSEVDKPRFVKAACAAKTGIGADGVLFVEDSAHVDFRMRYFNADGGEVEFCGNGARCIAYFANHRLGMSSDVTFDSIPGAVSAVVEGSSVSLQMPSASNIEGPRMLDIGGVAIEYYFVNTGVPHVVVFTDDLENAPVVEVGKKIRYHDNFQPNGANADFVRIAENEPWGIAIRTYERGVESETLACGTGATAAALVAAHRGLAEFPVKVHVALPDTLTISLGDDGRPILSGKVSEVFDGTFDFG